MSGNYENKSVKKKNSKGKGAAIAVVILLLIAAAAVFLLSGKGEQAEAADETVVQDVVQHETVKIEQIQQKYIPLRDGLELVDISSYTGAYVEDGSDEIVSGILMMKVINNSEEAIEYAHITMDVNGETAEFDGSTLMPGATVVLLEKNRMAYDKNLDYAATVSCENIAVYKDDLKLHEDKLKIQILDGAMNVINISQQDITGRVAIYYKNVAAGVYYGGITYRIILENGLKANEVQQVMAQHFSASGSEIMFVTIAE